MTNFVPAAPDENIVTANPGIPQGTRDQQKLSLRLDFVGGMDLTTFGKAAGAFGDLLHAITTEAARGSDLIWLLDSVELTADYVRITAKPGRWSKP